MDPLAAMRGDIETMRLDPIARAAAHAVRVDAIEAREEQDRRAALRDAREADRIMTEAAERQQIASRGYSDAELARAQADREGARQARIAELEDELDRIDPKRRAERAAEAKRGSQLARMDAVLGQAEELRNDPFMIRMQREWHQREIRRQAAYHESQAARLAGREITRSCDAGIRVT